MSGWPQRGPEKTIWVKNSRYN